MKLMKSMLVAVTCLMLGACAGVGQKQPSVYEALGSGANTADLLTPASDYPIKEDGIYINVVNAKPLDQEGKAVSPARTMAVVMMVNQKMMAESKLAVVAIDSTAYFFRFVGTDSTGAQYFTVHTQEATMANPKKPDIPFIAIGRIEHMKDGSLVMSEHIKGTGEQVWSANFKAEPIPKDDAGATALTAKWIERFQAERAKGESPKI
ncbi:hypothetical protein RYA05_01610 [Pseudomonas syringae pv. actinidiae]|nr:hypothetical protein [Pseudomonas syringae pv. actinidiae]